LRAAPRLMFSSPLLPGGPNADSGSVERRADASRSDGGSSARDAWMARRRAMVWSASQLEGTNSS
jgi:hypothetical protein